jgi:hypothetical protein
MASRVDFPLPDGPVMALIRPPVTATSTPRRACVGPVAAAYS